MTVIVKLYQSSVLLSCTKLVYLLFGHVPRLVFHWLWFETSSTLSNRRYEIAQPVDRGDICSWFTGFWLKEHNWEHQVFGYYSIQ